MFTSEHNSLIHCQPMEKGLLAMSLMAISLAASVGVTQFEQSLNVTQKKIKRAE